MENNIQKNNQDNSLGNTILSIDPGYERLGICVLNKNQVTKKITVIYSECFKTSKELSFDGRLLNIGLHLENLIETYKPKNLAIESLFMNTNQKTALKVSEVKGLIIYVCKKNNMNIFEYTPPQIKSAITGSGRSDKIAIQKMILILLPELKNTTKKIDDEYDAIACGLTHFAFERSL
jgi:crossover junction endodeoxyribonuclease RuvC